MGARVVVSLDGAIVTEVDLTKATTVVGRHPASDIVIDHPAVSARHMLLRRVDNTVYVEDLASTNGTRVNGLTCNHQVVHHLDLIEVGKHKIHFFDSAMLSQSVSNLESTVMNDFEQTMLAAHAPDPDLSRTMAIVRNPSVRLGPATEVVRTGPHEVPTMPLALRVVKGERPGQVIALERANTMIGTAGADTALVVRRGDALYLARFSGNAPRLNRAPLGPGSHALAPLDQIEVGNDRFEVIYA